MKVRELCSIKNRLLKLAYAVRLNRKEDEIVAELESILALYKNQPKKEEVKPAVEAEKKVEVEDLDKEEAKKVKAHRKGLTNAKK